MQNLRLKGRPPPIIFAGIDRLYNFAADSFHIQKLCSTLSSNEVQFYTENGRLAFLSPSFWGLEATYDDHH